VIPMTTDAEKLEALQDAYDSGVLRATYGDYSFEHRSLDDMERVIRRLEARISGVKNPGKSRRFASFSKGLK